MRRRSFFRLMIVGLMMPTLLSCTRGGPPGTVKVTGEVTQDGQPLPNGTVTFVPTAKGQSPWSGPVVNGRYELYVPSGPCRVQVYAQGEQYTVPETGRMTTRQLIPEKYNLQTILTADVPAENTRFDFHLEGAAK